MERIADTTPTAQFLTFRIGDEEYALSLLSVKEILQYEPLTRVPTTPPWIRGVMNLRGNVVPVVDLAVKFGLNPRPITSTTCIVIVEVGIEDQQVTLGVLADSVDQVIALAASEILPAPSFGTRVCVDYLSGVGSIGNRFALILNVDRVFSLAELLTTAAAPEQSELIQAMPAPLSGVQ